MTPSDIIFFADLGLAFTVVVGGLVIGVLIMQIYKTARSFIAERRS